MKIGYPNTLCGNGNFLGNGCSECCYGHIVSTDKANWEEIQSFARPDVLLKAIDRSIIRMGRISPGFQTQVRLTPETDQIGMDRLQREYDWGFTRQFPYMIKIGANLVGTIAANLPGFNFETIAPYKALANTNYVQRFGRELEAQGNREIQANLLQALLDALGRQLKDTGRTFDQTEITERLLYMTFPDYDKLKFPCPFLNTETHKCDIYDVRPQVCRVAGCYSPDILGYTGCGANLLYSSLSNASASITPKELTALNTELTSKDRLPLEFFLVKETAATGDPPLIPKQPRKRHKRK
jgi:hypothetical protein